MENITVGDIVAAIGVISVIASFIGGIIVALSKWWKSRVTDKFTKINNQLDDHEKRLTDVEEKRELYEHELDNSKFERMILMRGELSALKALQELNKNEEVSDSIKEIDDYLFDKSHGINQDK